MGADGPLMTPAEKLSVASFKVLVRACFLTAEQVRTSKREIQKGTRGEQRREERRGPLARTPAQQQASSRVWRVPAAL